MSKIPKNIVKAIKRSRLRGNFKYYEGGKPCCVIGQLGAMHGLTEQDYRYSDTLGKAVDKHLSACPTPAAVLGDKYGLGNLTMLQMKFDLGTKRRFFRNRDVMQFARSIDWEAHAYVQ